MRKQGSTLWRLYADAGRLAMESGVVVGLRVGQALQAAPGWEAEARTMVVEKADAALEVQALWIKSMLKGNVAGAPARSLALYRRKVTANRRRLSGIKAGDGGRT